jgi:hypothetical protein
MAYDLQIGSVGLRKEVVDAMVKQIAEPEYKFKQACAIVTTDAWKNSFFREDPTDNTAATGNSFKGVPWGANFPHSTTTWQEISVRIIKHAVETNIPWEQIISGAIDVQARVILRRTREVVKSVDDDIWLNLCQNGAAVVSYAVETAEHGAWSEASGAIIDDLMRASRLIAEKNYSTNDLMCFVSPKDKQAIMNYLVTKGTQFPSLATGIAENGRIGTLAGITLIESNSVTASWALVVKPKVCATLKQLVPLTTATTDDPLKSWRLRVVEECALEVTDPYAIVVLTGTQSV